jgi:hypothetical protein
MTRPAASEHAPYYAGYVSLVPEEDVLPVLTRQTTELRDLALAIGLDRETHAYASGKWSVREVFGHIVDAERVFGYRAFSISRGETQPLPGFDEKDYAAQARCRDVRLADLAREFALVREANLIALERVDAAAWANVGTASGHPVTVRALAYMMAGHVRHHLRVLAERYGITC